MTLGDFFVTISAKGVGAANSAISSVKPVMESLEKTAVKLGNTMKSVFVGATAAVYGFATAGIVGTVQGELFANQFRRMTLAIGSVFLPALYAAIDGMSRLTEWLQSLNKEQSLTIFKFAGLAGGIAMIASGIGTIPGIILTAVSGFYLLRDAIDMIDFSAIKPAILDIAAQFGEFYRAVLPDLKEIGSMIGELLVIGIRRFGEMVQAVLPSAISVFKSVIGIIKDMVASVLAIQPVVETVFGVVLAVVGRVAKAIAGVVSDIRELFDIMTKMGAGWKTPGNPEWATTKENHAAKMAERDAKANKQASSDKPEQLVNKVGGFESASGTYSRIAQAVINTFDPKKASDDQIGAINQGNAFLKDIADAFNKGKPAPAAVAP